MNINTATLDANSEERGSWSLSYEWRAVLLLCLGFGLVGIDRFMIMPLFPVIAKDLNLDYQDLGLITGVLSITWGLSALCMGNLSDRFGRRKVIIPSIIVFSLLAGLSGAATGLVSLLLIRAVMGLAEGAYTPASITATIEASKPGREGLNVGIQQAAMPLFGLAVAPILVIYLMQYMSWHWVFALVSVPGLLIAGVLYLVLKNQAQLTKETSPRQAPTAQMPVVPSASWREVFGYRNVMLATLGMLCWLMCLVVLTALLPSYLMDFLHLPLNQLGYVLSAIGVGGALGTLVMPALSDWLGRRLTAVLCVLGGLLGMWLLMGTGAEPARLFGVLGMTIFFVFGLICLTVGPISAEAVPPHAMSTATGIVIGIGEIFGGGIAPIIAGTVAKAFGIQYIMHLGIAALVLGLVACLALRETAPRRR